MSAVEKFFHKYQYLANVYANKVFNFENIGLEKCDIVQELKIKIFTSIEAYAILYKNYKDAPAKIAKIENSIRLSERYNFRSRKEVFKLEEELKELKKIQKPMPLQYYLKLTLINRVKDFIKQINRENKISINGDNFDYGASCTSNINLSEKKVVINDIDLLHDLNPEEKNIFILYLKGYSRSKLSKVFKDDELVKCTIDKQTQNLQKYKNDLYKGVETFKVFKIEEN